MRKQNQHACEEFYILINEAHCLGLNEPRQWTVREWKEDQGLDIYNEMNDLLMEVLSLKNRSGRVRLADPENELFCMACYDLDRFRDFAFEKRLWEAFSAGDSAIEAIQEDDVALMRFAIEWIKGALFGDMKHDHENTKRRKHERDKD